MSLVLFLVRLFYHLQYLPPNMFLFKITKPEAKDLIAQFVNCIPRPGHNSRFVSSNKSYIFISQ